MRPFIIAMKPKIILSLSSLLVFLLLVSCDAGSRYPALLVEADSLSEVDADSAVAYLNRLRPDMETAPEAVRNYYRLLCVKAADKAYIPHQSDSMILALVGYYEEVADTTLLPVAYYYAGRVYRDLGKEIQAIQYFQKALKLLDGSRRYKYLALSNSQIARSLANQELYSQALAYYRKSYYYDQLLGSQRDALYDLRDMAHVFRAVNQMDSAETYFQRAYSKALAIGADDMVSELEAQLGNLYVLTGCEQKARLFTGKALQHVDSCDTLGVYSLASEVYLKLNDIDSLAPLGAKLVTLDNVYAKAIGHYLQGTIAYHRHQPDTLYYHVNEYWKYNDSIRATDRAEATAKYLAMYDYSRQTEQVNQLEKEKIRSQNIVLVTSLLIVLVLFIIVTLWRRAVRQQKRAYQNLQVYKSLVKQHEKSDDIGKSGAAGQSSSRMTLLHDTIGQKLQSDSATIKGEEWNEIVSAIDEVYPGFIARLMQFCGRLSEQEFRVSLLIKLGYRINEIGALTAHTPQSVTNTRTRLFHKVVGSKGNAADWDKFILSL